MDDAAAISEALAFVASDTSKNNELAISQRHCAATGDSLLISSPNAAELARAIHSPKMSTILDTRHWHGAVATADVPTQLEDGIPLFSHDDWARGVLAGTRSAVLLTSSRFLPLGDRSARQALLNSTSTITAPNLVTFLPTDSEVLTGEHLADLLEDLAATRPRRFAFLFAHKRRPLENFRRLTGLRALLAAFPGSWVLGVDALAATDALAHGAGLAAVGSSSGRRWPSRPEDSGGAPPAAGWLPGLFLRDLFEFRSPTIYADWFANAPSPFCERCRRALDLFDPTPPDKEAIIEHSIHAVSGLASELREHEASRKPSWLNAQRVAAFTAHQQLSSEGAEVAADPTLLHLCSMDDPQMRTALKTGHWQ